MNNLYKLSLRRWLALLALLLPLAISARDFNYTYEGKTITYTVIDEEAKTCKTKDGSSGTFDWLYQDKVTGDLFLPTNPVDGNSEYTLVRIGDYAFNHASGMTSVTIPNSVTSIGKYAFSDCDGLKKAEFSSIDHLCSIRFESDTSNPLSYAEHLYIAGKEITDLVIPNSVTSIGDYAFSGCRGLTSVTIPNSVTSIGDYAFFNCSGMSSVTIPNSVTSIGNHAFSWCSGLTSVTIPNSVTSIGDDAFRYCSGLTSVTIPNSVASIGAEAFYGCSGLTSVTIPNSVTSIGAEAFYGCSGLTSVTIPNSVTSIGFSAFRGCSDLTSVTIPNSVTSIGSSAFRGCSGLTELIFNAENCTSCGYYDDEHVYPAFPTTIKSLTIGESVKNIPAYAFYGLSALTEVTIPESVTSIGDAAFLGCDILKKVNFNARECMVCGEKIIVFPLTTESLVFGENVTIIPPDVCYKMTGISRITIPNSVKTISEFAFKGCSGLTMVTMGDYVETVGKSAFADCTNLAKVKSGNANAWARINFENAEANPLCNASAKLYVGDDSELASSVVIEGAEPVGTYAFAGASFLEQVRVKDGAPVGANVFANCINLKQISLNTPSLADAAFSGCEALETIYSETATAPEASDDVFSNYDGVSLYVPRKCVSAYEDAPTCWWHFINISAKDMNDLDEIFTPSYVNNEIPVIIPVSEINLSKTNLTLEIGATFQLEAEVLPADATNKGISWNSANPQIVSIDNSGLLTAIAEGSATITATSTDGKVSASCAVTVVAKAPEPVAPGTPMTLYRIHNKHHSGKYLTMDEDKMLIAADLDESNPQQLFKLETVGDKVSLAAQGTYVAEASHSAEVQNGTSDTEPGLFYMVRNGDEVAFDKESPTGGTFAAGSRALSVPHIDSAHVTTWATGTDYSWWYLEEVSSMTLTDLTFYNGNYYGNITMPFAFATDAEVYTCQLNNNMLDMNKIDSEYIAAGTPVIIRSASPEATLYFLENATETATQADDNHLSGTLFAIDAPESAHVFGLIAGTERPAFIASNRSIGRNESYLDSNMADHDEVLLNTGDAVSIDELTIDGTIEVYDLRGVKVADTTDGLHPGIYIVKTAGQTHKIAI